MFNHDPDNLTDYKNAAPGQWFMGVLCTVTNKIRIAPVNPFEGGRGELNESVLNNCNERGMNRYASGTPGDREGINSDFATYNSYGDNWLIARRPGMTHHVMMVNHYRMERRSCLGFSVIKLSHTHALLKFTSNSLNAAWEGHERLHSFGRATYSKTSDFVPGTALMPKTWRDKIVQYFKTSPFAILYIAESLE